MKTEDKTKFISDVDMVEQNVTVKKPFKLQSENRRRFIRLEISSPMSLNRVKDIFSNFWPSGDEIIINGTILNISASGLLIDTDEPLNEGDIVSMHFSLQGVENINKVLGLVKRTDYQDDITIAGIQFVTKNDLQDRLSDGEMEMLDDDFCEFGSSVKYLLNRYIEKRALN
ncbi:MAG: PilZ domain-containing protein [candidate division Zixibacteria bacterium]|nr:PilZ domain-containing protein [candidate division Zixibacteria bacterium]